MAERMVVGHATFLKDIGMDMFCVSQIMNNAEASMFYRRVSELFSEYCESIDDPGLKTYMLLMSGVCGSVSEAYGGLPGDRNQKPDDEGSGTLLALQDEMNCIDKTVYKGLDKTGEGILRELDDQIIHEFMSSVLGSEYAMSNSGKGQNGYSLQ